MTSTLTLIDDTYSSNDAQGNKRVFGTISMTNPYSTGGEVIGGFSGLFKNKFLGGKVVAVGASVTAPLTGLATTAMFRGDPTSTASLVLQMFSIGLSATASAGSLVDNTTANISGTTVYVELMGR